MIKIYCLYDPKRENNRKWSQKLRITGLYMLRSLRSLRGCGRLGHYVPTPPSTHILPALVFAAQSPYSGWQNVIYTRNVMRNKIWNFYEWIHAAVRGGVELKNQWII
jgi:hypothetical protein